VDKALKMAPEAVIEEVKKSGLKGRGGAGFPTADKWLACRNAIGNEKYLICNADEADPSVYNGRTLIESDPHSVLEGMLIAAYAIGATHGYIFINDEFHLAISRFKTALKQLRESGLLGENIAGSNFNFDIEIREGAGAFVCGQETALIRCMEGNRGMPFVRPPYPAEAGFNGKPTVVNDVETLAAVSAILLKGADWYAGYGSDSKGTKLITLSGKVAYPGLIEVPFGITLRQIIYDIGGGIPNGKEFKAVQVGGPVGGFLTDMSLDTPYDYESLISVGTVMGTGGIYVADNEECIVDLARQSISFTQPHSCGQCTIGRGGTAQMKEFIIDMTKGEAKGEDVDMLLDLGEVMKLGALCGLCQNACNPVVTAINNYRDEITAHVNRRRCPAKVCKALVNFYINPNNCQGCTKCLTVCPVNAISGGEKLIHIINQGKCTKCGACLPVCPADYNAVTKATGGRMPPLPAEPIAVGSF
jgi:NADH-quinone oxidoreductase subunit F